MRKTVIITVVLLVLGAGSYGLAQVNWSTAFTCPKGQHSYVEYFVYVPITVGKTTVITPIPVTGCET